MAYSVEEKQKIFDDICERIIEGKSLRTALKEHDSIHASEFFVWIREDEAKSKQYARATSCRAYLIFEDMFDIADDGTNDWMEKKNEKGEVIGWVVNGEHIQRSKVRIETRRWALSKMMPKKYGDKPDTKDDTDNEIIVKIVD